MKISPEQLNILKSLKDLDHGILVLQTKKKNAPHLIENLDKKVIQALAAKDQANDYFEKLQLAQMQIEDDIKSNQDLLIRAKEKLQNISNDTEFKAATKEVEQLGKIIENKSLELPPVVIQVKLATQELEAKDTLLKAAEEERKACPEDINELLQSLEDNIKELNSNRLALTSEIEKPILESYEKVLANRDGLALVPAIGGSCGACRVRVRPQLYNQILQGNLEVCEACKRLLFAS